MSEPCYGHATRLRDLEGFLQPKGAGEDPGVPALSGAVQINGRVFRIVAFDRKATGTSRRYFKLRLRPEDGVSTGGARGAQTGTEGAQRGA